MSKTAIALVLAVLAGCAAVPPERAERDRAVLAAIEPCRQQHSEFFSANTGLVSVNQDGTVRYWRKSHLVGRVEEVNRCLNEATKDLKVGPWLPGRLTRGGPANVSISTTGRDVIVPVRVNGIPGTMAVRAGAEFTFLTSAYARRSGVHVVADSPTIRVRVGGQSIVAPYARARAIEVGDTQVEAQDVVVYEQVTGLPAVDGVLGKAFIGHFEMTIDRASGRLTLEPLRQL